MNFCASFFQTHRRKTRDLQIGSLMLGSSHPIRLQSMTTTPTSDVQATLEQIQKLQDAGCEMVRVTVQGMKEAKACQQLKNVLLQKGINLPLVADIHFYPPAAMEVVEYVDKVRINPGNYADKRATFQQKLYTDESYQQELQRVEEKFSPLVEKCKKWKKALRIGTNHGSLSDRILNRYGDTPKGMLISAVEYARVCRKYDFHDFLFSMKSSNTQVMIEAYRRLCAFMDSHGWDYPLHLGVTEAGEGEDGRIKSAVGIGTLLLDGIGDTLRVSLTEDPWLEMSPARKLLELAESYQKRPPLYPNKKESDLNLSFSSPRFSYPSSSTLHPQASVLLSLCSEDLKDPHLEEKLGIERGEGTAKKALNSCDAVYFNGKALNEEEIRQLKTIQDYGIQVFTPFVNRDFTSVFSYKHLPFSAVESSQSCLWVEMKASQKAFIEQAAKKKPFCFFLSASEGSFHHIRAFMSLLSDHSIPIIFVYQGGGKSREALQMDLAAELGSGFVQGWGAGLMILSDFGLLYSRKLAFNILQASRRRISKTEFISCPSCGRTLFNLQDVSQRIREKTEHLVGVKIAIMGCIVNGPGEMADADFGYVGSQKGKVDLYVGKRCVQRGIEDQFADEALIQLIKDEGAWIEPQRCKTAPQPLPI